MRAGAVTCDTTVLAPGPEEKMEVLPSTGLEKFEHPNKFQVLAPVVEMGDPLPDVLRDDSSDYVDEELMEPVPEQARLATPEPMATAPSVLEQARHCLTHLPFARWCPIFVKARAADQPHTVQAAKPGPEVVQFDYSFLDAAPILIGATRRTGYSFASAVRRKGAGDVGVVDDVISWLREAGLSGQLRIRSDGEPAIKALVAAVVRRHGAAVQETTPVKSSSSLGAAERFSRTLSAMVRTLRYALQDRTGIECSARSLLFNMLVMHANWLYCRYQPRQNGLTPFEDQHGRG